MTTYLDFEEPLKALEEQIEQTKKIGETTDVDMSDKVSELQRKLVAKTKDIFSKLSPWQRVQLSRHPDRPYTLAYINALTDGNFMELHGDRNSQPNSALSLFAFMEQIDCNNHCRDCPNIPVPI